MSPDNCSPACVPKQETHTGSQGSPTTVTLAVAERAKVGTGQQGQRPAGAGGQKETLPCKGLQGSRAFQKPTDPLGVQMRGDRP